MEPGTFRILVVDDERPLATLLSRILQDAGYQVETAHSGREALERVGAFSPNLVLTDLKMPDISGLELLRQVRSERPEVDFILLTAYATVETAVQAMKDGALDYLVKPLKEPEELRLAVRRALERQALVAASDVLRGKLAEGLPPPEILFAGMPEVEREIREVAGTEATVLLLGESGTGKSLVARAIHHLSGKDGPFVEINCAAIPETLIESELFGHERGAFTGAVKTRRGKFELAQGGTLFLDEIGELPLPAQGKLLRVVQDRAFERVGGTSTLITDARLVAATNQDLARATTERRFREDLYYRLNVFPVTLPPLRARRDALPRIAAHLVETIAARVGKKVRPPEGADYERLADYPWPGNIRELYNYLERAIILSREGRLMLSPPGGAPPPGSAPSGPETGPVKTLQEREREAIEEALRQTGGHRRKAAELLGISLRTLQYKLKAYGLSGRRGQDRPADETPAG
ncbi:sigma-54-dependent Fis family transcriptional regulator [Dissulfurirhabdus thermomarina]|uniref:Sigma-54-dependent Fis family transcriptional regulator n=1 Tax=Dissulfurirhabdus thermomarina TaxID=1765737 RepID=A0A6N9TVJ0_DISTH|nr:sigma-54 dependent transcriptional regulator [Dissulfurirhabdus thermomarina]NDY42506.1 sigma-54-dependent Fis family transcriptional regulator [Dissulfurirhabdus thermomarina]NMX24194.1 sigma-54-dependent Fis family transcriptional regulator [Dissulfurirhabdus thermomarina]